LPAAASWPTCDLPDASDGRPEGIEMTDTLTYRRPTVGPEAEGPTPGDLVHRAVTGDEAAWNALVDRFSGLVWSICRAHGLDRGDAADVSQTVWLRLVDHLGRIREPERVGAWLAATTRHECLRVSRVHRRTTPVADPEDLEDAMGAGIDEPVTGMAHDEKAAALWAVVETMPARSQALIRLLMADPPATYLEVAAGLGIPIGSIGPTRQRCLRTLRAKCVAAGIEL